MQTNSDDKTANEQFYDSIASVYDQADGRRRPQAWIRAKLEWIATLRGILQYKRLLDVGCGTGYIAKMATEFFQDVVGADLSDKCLDQVQHDKVKLWRAGADRLPCDGEYFDAVSMFALLHHVKDQAAALREARRVLKKGGVLWTDHDLDATFARRWAKPLEIYRKRRDAFQRYKTLCDAADERLYRASEVHENGVDSSYLHEVLKSLFSVVYVAYHWQGFLPISHTWSRPGWAPIVSFVCFK